MDNFDFEDAKKCLEQSLEPERYLHSIGVMETAKALAKRYGADENKAQIAGLLHDCAKNIDNDSSYKMCDELNIILDDVTKKSPKLVHQYLGAKIASVKYGICDEQILSAIRYHTTAKCDMTLLEKIIYLADIIEPNRDKEPFDGLVKLRTLCEIDIDEAMLFALDMSVKKLVDRNALLHIDTVLARNWFLERKIDKTLEK